MWELFDVTRYSCCKAVVGPVSRNGYDFHCTFAGPSWPSNFIGTAEQAAYCCSISEAPHLCVLFVWPAVHL